MSNNLTFLGPLLKTERADHHIAQLETIFRRYVEVSRKRLRPKRNANRREGASSLTIPMPRHTPTVLGDAIHNLRASLDHAYCILVEANGHIVTSHTKFPFDRTGRKPMEGSINGHIKSGNGPSEAVRDLILDQIQPFAAGNGADLLGLHELDITDKHTVLIPTSPLTRVERILLPDQKIELRGLKFVGAGNIFADNIVEPQNSKTLFDICFEKGQPFEGQSILAIMRTLKRRVVETLDALAKTGGVKWS